MERLFDFKKAQMRWDRVWEEKGIFTPEVPSSRESFAIILPPPNVTGILTVGHVLGDTVQDLLIRWKRMKGFNCLWLPGTDHAGIATQKVVEDELEKSGRRRSEMTRGEFLDACWAWKERHHEHILAQLKRLGCALDWTRECFTLDEPRSRAVREVFVRLYNKGLIYRGDYIVNWCPSCETAISDEEVEYEEKDAHLYWIRYPIEDGTHALVATTRPETMLGDTAVAVNPEDEQKKPFIGKTAVLPLVGRKLPIIADSIVDPEFGSGFVKVTPAHDPNDFDIGKRHGLPSVVVIDRQGKMTEKAGKLFAGLDRLACREKVLNALREQDLLEKIEPYRHSVGQHDRCNTVIEPLVSEEWFVKMQPLAEPAIGVVERGEIELFPPRWKNVYLSWMHNIRDWCISRQLWWGHRIPVWYCPQGHLTVSLEDPAACATCGAQELEQDENVLDTWFSSWLWTFSPMGWPGNTEDLKIFHPTSVLVTGPDIIFFWVARMIMASLEFMREIPFRHVFFTGIVRDDIGRKLSKSLGNSPDPLDVIDRYGTDAFRFTLVMLSPPGRDVFFSESKLEMGRNFINKIWQASRLVLGAVDSCGFDSPSSDSEIDYQVAKLGSKEATFGKHWREVFQRPLGFEPLLEWEDKWILGALGECIRDVEEQLSTWRLNDAASRIYDFFWHDYCDWYIELAKIRLYGTEEKGTVLSVLLFILGQSLKLLHPLMPYVTEELWSRLPGSQGLLLENTYPSVMDDLLDEQAAAEMRVFRDTVAAARNIRSQYRISPSARIRLFIKTPEGGEALFHRMQDGLRQLVRVESLEVGPSVKKERGCAASPVGEYEVIVPLAGVADLKAEMNRLEKEKRKLEAELTRVEKKLASENFLLKAKRAVIQKEREKKAVLRTELGKIKESLDIISGTE